MQTKCKRNGAKDLGHDTDSLSLTRDDLIGCRVLKSEMHLV